MNVLIVLLCLVPAILSLASCSHAPTTYQLHYDINNPDRLKFNNNVLLFPTNVAIKERFPGGVIEDIPAWTSMTNQIIIQELGGYLASTLGIRSTLLQADNDASLVKNHTALLKLVNRSIRKHTRGWNLWPHKRKRFDYTIGPGLSFLRNKNVDTAIVINGIQVIGVAKYDETLSNISAYPGDQLTFGLIRFNISLINLDTGDILWSNIDNFTGVDMRQSGDVKLMLAHALKSFPVGIFSNN